MGWSLLGSGADRASGRDVFSAGDVDWAWLPTLIRPHVAGGDRAVRVRRKLIFAKRVQKMLPPPPSKHSVDPCLGGRAKDHVGKCSHLWETLPAVLGRGAFRGCARPRTAGNVITSFGAFLGAVLDRATPLGTGSLNGHPADAPPKEGHVHSCPEMPSNATFSGMHRRRVSPIIRFARAFQV